mgnify:CR=1 FL=1
MVLHISAKHVSEIWDKAEAAHPDEACGVIAGAIGSDTPTRHIPMVNAAHSPTFYEFESDPYLSGCYDSIEEALEAGINWVNGKDEI